MMYCKWGLGITVLLPKAPAMTRGAFSADSVRAVLIPGTHLGSLQMELEGSLAAS